MTDTTHASALERFAQAAADLANQAAEAEADCAELGQALNDEATKDVADKRLLEEITERIKRRAHWFSLEAVRRDELKAAAARLRDEAGLAARYVEELRARAAADALAAAAERERVVTTDAVYPPPTTPLSAVERLAAEQAAREDGAQA